LLRIHPPCGAMTDEEAQDPHVRECWEKTYIKNLKYSAHKLDEVMYNDFSLKAVHKSRCSLFLSVCCFQAGIMLLIEPVTTIKNCFLSQTKQGKPTKN